MIEFSESQKRTVVVGLTVLSFSVVFAFVLFLAWAVFSVLTFASAAVVPVFIGFFLAFFFKPYYRWWLKIVRNPTVSAVLVLVTLLVPLGLLFWRAGSLIVDEVTNLIHQGPALAASVQAWFKATCPKLHSLAEQSGFSIASLGDAYLNVGGAAFKAGAGAMKFLSGAVSLLLVLIFFVFFLMTKERRGTDIVGHVPFLKDETKAFVATQIDAFFDILVGFFQRQVVICLIEGVYYGLGFLLVGLPYGFLIGFCLGTINLIPLFGSLVCLPVAVPLAYFGHGGSTLRLCLVLGVWVLGQVLDGYFITPKIQGNRTGLGYAGVIFSFVFWATVLGPVIGMLLAIPLSAFCVVLWRALKERYIKPLV